MINILIPLAGKESFKINETNAFPKVLHEIDGKLLIEHAAKPFISLKLEKQITVALPQYEMEKYQLSKVISLLGDDIKTCSINGSTQGSACSALLAIENFDLDTPLIISSFEQVFDFDITDYILSFIEDKVDAGVLTFEAIHPKWSYVKSDENGIVTQAAEKTPISNQAIAGLYYYKTTRIFIDAAKDMIRKDVKTNNRFYIAPTLNEIILREGSVKSIGIDKSKYFHITDHHTLEAFETKISIDKDNIKKILLLRTKEYIEAFNRKNINDIALSLSDSFRLNDPNIQIEGKAAALDYINSIFDAVNILIFKAKNIFVSDDQFSIIEFELIIDSRSFVGTDIISWNSNLQMLRMDAYLYEKVDGKE